ncbi:MULTISPECIES: hypothetical protein [unclassified Pseudoalteromonas]|uniref:hypothetical protein n=1 Tax=unclassified Pseudoalteromonas TaxID=194690 RepID=UPI002096CA82|nr:hypothetical protein [Pseudoalteromonas sp. XMcav2-N]MCO7191332.1 hypothetical protein [Pseudoalteromonas sp. XMcav2-N]
MKFLVCLIGGLALVSTEASPLSFAGNLTVGAPSYQYHFATSSGAALNHLVTLDQVVSEGEPLLSYKEAIKDRVKLILAGSQGVVTELNADSSVSKGELLAKLLTPTLLGIFEPAHEQTNTPRELWFCHVGNAFKVKVSYESREKMFVTLHLNEYVTKVSESFKSAKPTTLFADKAECVEQVSSNKEIRELP